MRAGHADEARHALVGGKLAEREHGPALHLGVGVAVDGLDNGADGALAGAPRQPKQGLPPHPRGRGRARRAEQPVERGRLGVQRQRGHGRVGQPPRLGRRGAGAEPGHAIGRAHAGQPMHDAAAGIEPARVGERADPLDLSTLDPRQDHERAPRLEPHRRRGRRRRWRRDIRVAPRLESAGVAAIAAGAAPAARVVVAGDDRHGIADPRHLGDARGDLGDGRRQSARRRALHHLAVRHHRPARRLRVERHPGHRQPRHRQQISHDASYLPSTSMR